MRNHYVVGDTTCLRKWLTRLIVAPRYIVPICYECRTMGGLNNKARSGGENLPIEAKLAEQGLDARLLDLSDT